MTSIICIYFRCTWLLVTNLERHLIIRPIRKFCPYLLLILLPPLILSLASDAYASASPPPSPPRLPPATHPHVASCRRCPPELLSVSLCRNPPPVPSSHRHPRRGHGGEVHAKGRTGGARAGAWRVVLWCRGGGGRWCWRRRGAVCCGLCHGWNKEGRREEKGEEDMCKIIKKAK